MRAEKFAINLLLFICCTVLLDWAADAPKQLKAGAAAIAITPFGSNPDWKGPITESGVWGDKFTDSNHNGHWDEGEPFQDDSGNARIDTHSQGRYAGIYLAGFCNNRPATGKHDDLWARALVIELGGKRIAIIALDFIGYYHHAGYYGGDEARKLIDPALGIDELLVASTHNHEGPDTIGLWGSNSVTDGKFPLYLQFVDHQIAKAVNLAATRLAPVRMKIGVTTPAESSSLREMQTRTAGRPPFFYDQEMRVIQFVSQSDPHKVVATLVNWNTHPESMEDENTVLTSDFPGTARDAIEKKYGGTAIYISGDLGAVEIVGDNDRSSRTNFDGMDFPIQRERKGASFSFARMEAIGREVARAASEAIERGEWSDSPQLEIRKAELRFPLDNVGYQFLMSKGVLEKMPGSDAEPPQMVTTIYAIRLGDAEIITAPGELFPEVFYGVEKNRRRDCAKADTGRLSEPAVRDAMKAKYKFVFGLCPDEMGYMVPGYDFLSPTFDPEKGPQEAADACASAAIPAHYHETNSASSQFAPAWACAAIQLLTGKPSDSPACSPKPHN